MSCETVLTVRYKSRLITNALGKVGVPKLPHPTTVILNASAITNIPTQIFLFAIVFSFGKRNVIYVYTDIYFVYYI